MKKLHFKIELLSDIILNQKAATEGPNATLDFIPGANFMGIVANGFYSEIKEKHDAGQYSEEDCNKLRGIARDIFHSGDVHFGDAHLGIEEKEGEGTRCIRTCKVPAAFFYPKLANPSDVLYISHLIPEDEDTQKNIRKMQLKQMRNGFCDFTKDKYIQVKSEVSFAIKSAHDRDNRTSKISKMYGYQSLGEGAIMFFEVETPEKYENIIKKYLTVGTKRVGRSRSAQYGLIKISALAEDFVQTRSNKASGRVTVYADSRLIFIDEETGACHFRPTARDLGLGEGKINWAKSQVRTFQYSPWNFTRQCFDTDRCGFEKGSVFVVDNVDDCPNESKYVGEYNNEGFGRIIFNPEFLKGDINTGIASNKFKNESKPEDNNAVKNAHPNFIDIEEEDEPLMKYLKQAHNDETAEQKVYELVNEWVEKNAFRFKKDFFASQWGTIRTIATQYKTRRDICNELYKKTLTKEVKDRFDNKVLKTIPKAYLTHGVASEKWKGDRLNVFRNFCEDEVFEDLTDKYFRFAIINLAAEMAKRCRKENGK